MGRVVALALAMAVSAAALALSAQTVAEVKTATAGAFAVECAKPDGWRFSLKTETKGAGLEEVRLVAEADAASVPPPFAVRFSIPKGRLQHVWDPFEQCFPCCWTEQSSSFSVGLPLRVNYDDDETNVLTLAVSDALNAIRFRTDVDMRNDNAHMMEFAASFFDDPNPPRTRYETVFRLDSRAVFWSRAAEDGVRWISATAVMRQMWNVAFSVIQYSACLKDLPAAHLDVIRKSICFMNEHRRTLLFGKLTPHRPDLGYPCVEAESESERIVVVYAPEYVALIPADGKRTLLVNATRADSLVVERDGRIARHSVRPSDYLAFGVAHR